MAACGGAAFTRRTGTVKLMSEFATRSLWGRFRTDFDIYQWGEADVVRCTFKQEEIQYIPLSPRHVFTTKSGLHFCRRRRLSCVN